MIMRVDLDTVTEFEKRVAKFFGAPYAVSTDSCTHAIELCMRYKNLRIATVPKHTYLSVPMTVHKLGGVVGWTNANWKEYYHLGKGIYDAAVLWRENSYVENTFMCVSFQWKKHLNLGRGGVILLDDKEAYETLIKMGYDGRSRDARWVDQDIEMIGYHYYMTPETAQLGLDKLNEAIGTEAKKWSWKDYPDLTKMKFRGIFDVKL